MTHSYITLLIHVWHVTTRAMTHSYITTPRMNESCCTWIYESYFVISHVTHGCDMSHMHVCHDTFTYDMPHSYATRLIHTWHNSSIWDTTHTRCTNSPHWLQFVMPTPSPHSPPRPPSLRSAFNISFRLRDDGAIRNRCVYGRGFYIPVLSSRRHMLDYHYLDTCVYMYMYVGIYRQIYVCIFMYTCVYESTLISSPYARLPLPRYMCVYS